MSNQHLEESYANYFGGGLVDHKDIRDVLIIFKTENLYNLFNIIS